MDNFRQPRQVSARFVSTGSRPLRVHTPVVASPAGQPSDPVTKTFTIKLGRPHLPPPPQWFNRVKPHLRSTRTRVSVMAFALIIVASQIITLVQPMFVAHTYAMENAESLLPKKDKSLGDKLKLDTQKGAFNYNQGYTPANATTDVGSGGPQITAVLNQDLSKGITVTDPVNKVDFVMKPLFKTYPGKQDGNRILYPLKDGTGWVVYTMQLAQVKEDVLLSHANGDRMTLRYDLDLSSQGLEARKQADGSVGVFGSSLPITGNITTGSDKDAALLQKARAKAKKDKLLFSLPTPKNYDDGGLSKQAVTTYSVKQDVLISETTGLKKASFPLDVDPAVTVVSTTNPFRDTNPDSNIDLDASTGNISRGDVSGGVVTTNWSTTNVASLASPRFLAGYAIYNDYAYVAGGAAQGSTTNVTTVEYALMNKNDAGIGTTGSWNTTTALPVALSKFHLIAYNGYLYAIGGATGTTNCATNSDRIYYNRIQTNGQLSSTWIDAFAPPAGAGVKLPTAGCGMAAAIANNKIYVSGGKTASGAYSSTNMISGFLYANVNPNGSIGSFTSVATSDTSSDAEIAVYNNYIYFVGGIYSASGAGVIEGAVYYYALDSQGVLSGSGKTTSSLNTERINLGANFLAANDGYMYVQGGCRTVNTNASCTAIRDDLEIAQINADGTLGAWVTIPSTATATPASPAIATLSQVGGGLLFWRGTIYVLGGCSAMPTNAVQCTTTIAAPRYDTIASAGQVGPLRTATTLPADTSGVSTGGGVWAAGTVVNNGYIYVIGGCLRAACGTAGANNTSTLTYYAPISATGSLGTWVKDTKTLNANGNGALGGTTTTNTGLAAFSTAVYNNVIYLIGGYYYNGNAQTGIWFAKPGATGALAANWVIAGTTANAILFGASTYQSSYAYRGFLYVFGGCTSGSATSLGCSNYLDDVTRYAISATDGTLSGRTQAVATVAQLPVAKAVMAMTVYNGYVYLSGGATGTGSGGTLGAQTNTTFYGKLNNDNTLTSWIGGTGGTTGKLPTNTVGGNASCPTYCLRRASSFAMNGYLYVIGGHNAADTSGGQTNGNTYPYIFIGKINMATGDIAGFTQSVTTITARWDAATVFSNGYIYTVAGCSSGYPPTSCASAGVSRLAEYVELYNAGNKGTSTWTGQTAGYTSNRYQPAATAYNGYLYVAGGCTAYSATGAATCTGVLDTVAYAPINPDGSFGSWTTDTVNKLPVATNTACMVGVGNTLYVIGGRSSANAAMNNVSYSAIGSGGTTGVWTAGTALTNGGTAYSGAYLSCATFNGHIYVTGGTNSTSQNFVSYTANDLSSGGNVTSWSAGTAMQTARSSHSTVIAGGYLYEIGGYDGTNSLQSVEYIQLVPSGGTTGSWAYSTDLPAPIREATAFAANGYIYISGGRSTTSACVNTTWVASINSTGTTSSWSQGANVFTKARYGVGGGYYNGYYYVVGGYDCSGNTVIPNTDGNAITSGGQQSQAMEAIFSKYADLNGDGDPQKLVIYLTNAVNNGVDIEKWKMTYISSRESDNTWGQATVIAPLINQNAYNVNAYNSSGTDQLLARWFYLQFSIDMAQSFTFTDDVQPYINQYGLHYSPPPSKRLMHGRDFRDQTQQGLDLKL